MLLLQLRAEKLISLIERYNLQKFDIEINHNRDKQFFASHNYGFPFIYGLGLNYIKEDKYLATIDVNSSFVFSSISAGIGVIYGIICLLNSLLQESIMDFQKIIFISLIMEFTQI